MTPPAESLLSEAPITATDVGAKMALKVVRSMESGSSAAEMPGQVNRELVV